MKKDFLGTIITSLAIIAGTSSLYAGGMGPINKVHNWTGFYLGGNAGAMWGPYSAPVWIETLLVGNSVIGPSVQSYNEDLSSFTGGGQLGYNYQTNTNWLIGAEFSFNGERMNAIHSLRAMESRRRGRVVPGSLRAGCFSAGKI